MFNQSKSDVVSLEVHLIFSHNFLVSATLTSMVALPCVVVSLPLIDFCMLQRPIFRGQFKTSYLSYTWPHAHTYPRMIPPLLASNRLLSSDLRSSLEDLNYLNIGDYHNFWRLS